MKRQPVAAIDPRAVEILGDRTATTDTFQNPDGSRTLRVYPGQQNVRQPNGSWKPVDLNLAPRSDGRFWPQAAPMGISFARSANDTALASVWFDRRHSMSYALTGAAAVPGSVSGGTILYPNALHQADVRETATRAGVSEDIVLRSPQAPSSYVFTLHTAGLRPSLRGGDIQLADALGTVRAIIPAATMTDSRNNPHTGTGTWSGGARYTLTKAGLGTWRLGLHLDTAWLDDPARVYPVTVDPSAISVNADSDDTYVQSGTTSDHSSEPDLIVGSPDGGRTIARAYFHFGGALNALRNDYITGASLVVDDVYSQGTAPLTLFAVTQPWSGNQVYPGAAAGQALDTETYGSTGCAGTWQCFSIDPQIATDWTHGTALTNGLTLRAANESDSSAFKRYASANSPNSPYLDVRYSPDGAAYQVSSVLLPTANQQGNVVATVTNEGSSTWPAGGGFRLGYVVQQNGTVVGTSQGVAPSTAVGPGQSATITVPLTALTPGNYDVDLTMWTPGGQDFHSVYGVPYGDVPITVTDVAPTSDSQQPGSGATVQTLTPTLYAHGVDPDDWPGKGLTYQFLICSDQNLSQNCRTSPWGPPTWAPPAGTLSWSKTYYWGVRVNDTVLSTPCSVGPACAVGPLALTTAVPQPEITSHLGGTTNTAQAPGLDPQTGNYTTAATDASVPTAGPDLTITRTYNSLDPRRDTAFGVGWSSRLDMRLQPDSENGQVEYVLVTYPDGQQIRFGRNPDGTFAPPLGENLDLVYDSSTGIYTLRDASGTRWQFDVLGRLAEITNPAGLTEHLTYDSNDHVTTITNDVSGRTLTFTWNSNHVTSVTEPPPDPNTPPPTWTYTYNGDDLTQVCAPGAGTNCTTYSYTTGSHYRSSVIDDNPVAYYRLDETSGTTFASAVAREPGADAATQHGVTLGSAGSLAGTSDQAATFDGSSSYVTLPDGLVNATMSLAVELWFKTTGSGTLLSYSDQAYPPGTPDSTNTPLLYVGVDGLLYGGFAADTEGGPRQVVSQAPVNDGQWHHVVLNASINAQSMYLDGVNQGSVSGLIDQASMTKMVLGAGYTRGWPSTSGGNFYFNGSIDELAVYQHPLSEFAIAEHYGAAQAIDELTAVHTPEGRLAAQLTYDDVNDRVRTLTDQDGIVWTLDAPTQLDATRTVVLHSPYPDWTYTYDADHGGRLTSVTHLSHTRSYQYNDAGFLSAVTDEDGNTLTQTTDARGNVLSRTTCRTQNACDTTYYSYVQTSDPLDPRTDKLASVSDARSSGPDDTTYRTSYSYDSAGRLISATYPIPAGQTTAPQATWTYATGAEAAVGGGTVPAGELISFTSRRGQVTHYSYYNNGDLAQTLTPAGLLTQYRYNELGLLVSKTTGNGGGHVFSALTYTYTPLSQVQQVSGPAVTDPVTGVTHTQVTSYTYDADGNMLTRAVSDSSGGDPTRTTTYTYNAHDRMASVTFPDGGQQTYTYSPDMLTQTTTDVNGTAWTYQYDDQHRLIALTASGPGVDPQDPSSTGLGLDTWSYDPAGRLARVTDAMGRATDYTYYGDGLLATVTAENVQQPDGSAKNVVTDQRAYDPAGNLTQETTAGGAVTVNTYDPAGYLATSTFDPGGLDRTTSYLRDADGDPTQVSVTGAADPTRTEVTSYTYTPSDQIATQSVSLGGAALTTSFGYDERGLITSITDPRQITTHYSYDANGNLSQTVSPPADVWTAGTDQPNVAATTTLGYNTFGEVTQAEDSAGNITTTTRDSMGRAITQTLPPYTPPGGQPITATTQVQYDHAGNPVKVTDALGRVTAYTYDPYGRLTSVTLPQAGSTPSVLSYGYDRDGELIQQTDPTGAQSRYTYDALGRQLTSTQVERYPGPLAYYTTTTSYDAAGDPIAVQSPQGFTTTNAYDAAGELTSTTTPTGATTSYTYDADGRQASTTDPTGLTTATTYDLAGRPVKVTQSAGGQQLSTSTATFDADGNLTATTSPAGRSVSYGYDALDRLATQTEQVTSTSSITTSTGYDALGDPSHVVDGNGNATDYTYNSWGLPESTIEPATPGATSPADRTWTTSYDADGEPVTVTEPGGITQTTTYNPLGQPTSQTATGAPTTPRTLGYDADGRITSVGGPGGATTYTYDDRGDLLSAQGPQGNASYAYNGDGTLASRTDAAGTTSFQYNSNDQVTAVTDPVTGRSIKYGYDPAGQLTNIADSTVASRISRSIGYNALGQVSTDDLLQYYSTGIPPRTLLGDSYTYDQDGLITGKATTVNGSSTTNSYGYDGLGRLTSWTTGSTTTNYTWDNAGNRTSAGGQAYTYNARNELVSGSGATYTYTPRGTLSSVTANGNTTQAGFDGFDRMTSYGASNYTYDSLDRVAAQGSNTFSYDGLTNNVVTDGSQTFSYLPDGTPLAFKATGSTGAGQLLFSDAHGDVTGSYLGAVVGSTRTFDPFGAVIAATGQGPDLGYQGGWTDAATGTVNMGARWYSPAAAQFTSQDSMNLSGPPSTSANRYTYADGSPLNATDPTGHDSCYLGFCGGGGGDTCGLDPTQLASYDPSCGNPSDAAGAAAAGAAAAGGGVAPGSSGSGGGNGSGGGGHGNGGHGSGGGHGPGGGGIGGGHAAPPPPPGWLVAAMTPQPRPPAGSTVTNVRPPAINLDQNQQITYTDPGPGITAAATKVTVAPASADPSAIIGQGIPTTCTAAFNPAAGGSSCGNGEQSSQLIPGVPGSGCLPVTGDVLQCPPGTPGTAPLSPGDPSVHSNSWLDNLHQSLNLFGFLPIIGAPANGLNGIIYGAQGQWGNAGSSFLGAIPGEKLFGLAGKLFGFGDSALSDAGRAAAGGVFAACGESFTPATKVLLANGAAVPIASLRPGDKVLATNTMAGKTNAERIAAVLVRHDTNLYDLRIRVGHATAIIHTTSNHLFWNPSSHHWIKAAALKYGARLQAPAGTTVTVAGGHSPAVRTGSMWDLTVAGDHDFYIQTAAAAVLVHNCPITGALSATGRELDPVDKSGILTRAGRAYAKAPEIFGPTSGGKKAINIAGQKALDDILNNPRTIRGTMNGGNFAGGPVFISPDGVGAVFSPDGVFQYFGRMPYQ